MTNTIKHDIRHPRDVAKQLIRKEMIQGTVVNLFILKKHLKNSREYSAYMDDYRKKIVVTKFYGIPIHEEYEIYQIMQDILEEVKQSLTAETQVFFKKSQYSIF